MANQPRWRSLTPDEALSCVQAAAPHAQIVNLRVRQGVFQAVNIEEVNDALEVLNTLQTHERGSANLVAVRTDFRTTLEIRDADNPSDGPVGAIDLRFSTVTSYTFNSAAKLDVDTQVVFAKVQAIMHSWPYWREFAQSSLARMGMQTRVAPVLVLPQALTMAGFADSKRRLRRKKTQAGKRTEA